MCCFFYTPTVLWLLLSVLFCTGLKFREAIHRKKFQAGTWSQLVFCGWLPLLSVLYLMLFHISEDIMKQMPVEGRKFNKVYCTVLSCTVLHCTVLYCTALHCTVLYCTVLYCTALYCIVLYCTVLYCTVMYYNVL